MPRKAWQQTIALKVGDWWVRIRYRLRGPQRFPSDGLTIGQAEARIRQRRYEVAYVFAPTGRQLLRQEGGTDFLLFAGADLPRLRNAVVLHNHPPNRQFGKGDPRYEGGSFSRNDLDLAVEYDLAELRAVTPGWRYVLIRPSGGWSVDPDTVSAIYDDVTTRVRAEFDGAVVAGEMTAAESEGRVVDEVVRRTARLVGFTYRREPA